MEIKNIEQLENIIKGFKEKTLHEEVKALNFDNEIMDILGVENSLFDSDYNIYDNVKTYYIASLEVAVYVEYKITYEDIDILNTYIFIEDIFIM